MWFNAKIKLFIEIHCWLPRVEKLSNLVNEIPFSFWYIYVIYYIENIVVVLFIVITLKKKLFIYQRISWNFVSVVIYLFYTYVFFFSNAIIDVKFCFSSSVWNLIMKRILKNIYSLCLSKHEFWGRVLNCFGCLWYRCLFIYIYV